MTKCARCGSPDDLTRHHVIPKSRGGKNDAGNISWLCRQCHNEWHRIESWADIRRRSLGRITWFYTQWLQGDKQWAVNEIGKAMLRKAGYW